MNFDLTYRWYLCSRDEYRNAWKCNTIYKEEQLHITDEKTATIIVPINKWIPTIFDGLILNRKLSPQISRH